MKLTELPDGPPALRAESADMKTTPGNTRLGRLGRCRSSVRLPESRTWCLRSQVANRARLILRNARGV